MSIVRLPSILEIFVLPCDVCEKKLKQSVRFENHERKVTKSKLLFVKKLPECNFTNASRMWLKIHIRDFMCENCKQIIFWPLNLDFTQYDD